MRSIVQQRPALRSFFENVQRHVELGQAGHITPHKFVLETDAAQDAEVLFEDLMDETEDLWVLSGQNVY